MSGFSTWDMADIYGPAEEFLGKFRKQLNENDLSKSQALTKFVPSSGPMSRPVVEHYIDQSIRRMNVKSIDVLQFHWWDYNDTSYIDTLHHLTEIRDEGKIRHLGLTNFDTERIQIMTEQGFTLVSNQVQFSIIDQRPEVKMIPFCQKHDIKLLTYGTLLGGFLSEKYLGASEPIRVDLDTQSLQKYKNMIDAWGGWSLFQKLLVVLEQIAQKHNVSIANVATRFILGKPSVAGVIIGARLGISEHRVENNQVFGFELDSEDYEKITTITAQSKNLFEIIGDCGDEYR
jgi:aryl-alcohol dehydrogenase-like predicted oxidoreductase